MEIDREFRITSDEPETWGVYIRDKLMAVLPTEEHARETQAAILELMYFVRNETLDEAIEAIGVCYEHSDYVGRIRELKREV